MSQPTTTSTTTTPSPPPPSTLQQPHPFRPLFLTLLLACPVLALLPPRKLDLYTFTLSGAWVYSATELAYAHPRRVRLQQDQAHLLRMMDTGITQGGQGASLQSETTSGQKLEDEHVQKGEMHEDGGVRGLIHKIWMGDEKAGWQKRRLEREKEELESGKSYGDLIMEQVREVFPGFGGGGGGRGRDGEEDGEEEDGDGDGGEGGG